MPLEGTSGFPETPWSVILRSRTEPEPRRRATLEAVYQAYYGPLYAYARWRGNDAEEAKDLVQDTFVRCHSTDVWAYADPGKMRLRTLLISVMKQAAAERKRHRMALKRGGRDPHLSLDEAALSEAEILTDALSPTHSPEAAFDRAWAQQILRLTEQRVESTWRKRHASRQYDALQRLLVTGASSSYAGVAEEMGGTVGALRTGVHRLRQQLKQTFRDLVEETMGIPVDEAALDEEVRYLSSLLINSQDT